MKGITNTPIIIGKARAHNLEIESLEIKTGCTLVHGPMGSGKTALLRDILGSELKARTNNILRPIRSLSLPEAEILNLPAGIFISGEPNKIPQTFLGETLGLISALGKLIVKSSYRICPNCGNKNKFSPSSEIPVKLLKDLEETNPKKVILTVFVKTSAKEVANEMATWRSKGFDEVESYLEQKLIKVKLDALSSSELNLSRLKESLTPHLKPGRYIEVTAITPDNSEKQLNIFGTNICQKCLIELPKLRASTFGAELLSKSEITAEQRALLQESSLDENFMITGESLLRSSIAQLKSNQLVSGQLPTICRKIISNLLEAGLGDLEISTRMESIPSEKSFYVQMAKAAFLTSPDALLLIDDPCPLPSENIKKAFGNLLEYKSTNGGFTLLATNNPSFSRYAARFIKLGSAADKNTNKILSFEPFSANDSGTSPEFRLGLDLAVLQNSTPDPETIFVKTTNLNHQSGRTVLSLLKVENLICELLGSTVTAKALGYSAKDILKLSPESAGAKTIRFNDLTFPEICQLKVAEFEERFSGIGKLKKILGSVSELGLGHINLNTPLNDLSLQERILIACLKVARDKPKNKIIHFQNVLDRLSEKELSVAKNWLKKNLGVTNCIISETVNPTT